MLELLVTEVPEGLEKAYVKQEDGTFKLDFDDTTFTTQVQQSETKLSALQTQLEAAKGQVDEFRTNNRKLFNEKQELLNQPDADVNNEVLTELNDLRTSKSDIETKYKQTAAQLEQIVLTDSVSKAAIKYGVQTDALVDVTNRAKAAFKVEDGKAIHISGKENKDGDKLSIVDWMAELSESTPHLFNQSQGSGTKRSVNGINKPNMTATQKIAAGLK